MFLCFLKKKKKLSINMTQVNMTQYFHQVYSTGFINKFCFCKCASTDEQMDQLKAHFTMLYSNCSLYIFKADLESVAGKMISYKNTNKYDRFSLVLTQKSVFLDFCCWSFTPRSNSPNTYKLNITLHVNCVVQILVCEGLCRAC